MTRPELARVNVTDFYNEISLLYGVLMDVCTPTTYHNVRRAEIRVQVGRRRPRDPIAVQRASTSTT